ncbi:hypothetical protein IFM89_038048 [Coptis chinensis]|uniref:RNase H type-1 domain-containing protein n=1 Tax=Coptis chinensis TaxID=261450 RepID=A0A835LKT2_9MAGN|nr:hypothetical protein IFM89_038048 [Coptis chinensis]
MEESPDVESFCQSTLFCALMDAIWQARNNTRFNNVRPSQQAVLKYAYRSCSDWYKAFDPVVLEHEGQDVVENTLLPPEQHWIMPPPGWCKINFDASFQKRSSYANIAVIGRNSDGEYLKGKVSKVRASTPGEAEALAAELAVEFAVQQHWKEVIFEGDAKRVIQACENLDAVSLWSWQPMCLNISSKLGV